MDRVKQIKNHSIRLLLLIFVFSSFRFTIIKAQTLDLQVNFSKQSPIKVGDEITISSTITNTSNILYKYWIYDGLSWKVVQDYSSNNTFKWKPNHAGQYRIWVDAKDKSSTNERDTYKEILYEVKNDVVLSSVTTSRVEPIPAGTSIDIKAASTGAVNPLYQFWVDDGQGWKLIQDFSKTSSVTWKPDKEGTYTIWVGVKESNSTYSRDDFKQFSYTVNSGAQIDAVNFSKESPAKVGDSITVTAAASKSNNILYKFWIYDGLDWKVVQDYSEKNTYTWKPNHAGQHRVWAEVKDKYSTKEKDSYKEILYEVKNDVVLSSVTTSRVEPIPAGTSININAASTGAVNPLYQFWVDDGQGWKLIQDFSKTSSVTWKPDKEGTYTIWVGAKESNSTYSRDDFKQFSYTVNSGAQIDAVNFSKESPAKVGDSITVTAAASKSNNILYKFWIYDGLDWKVVQDYSEKNTYTWKPNHAGQHRVWVEVKDKYSTKEKDSYKEILYEVKNDVVLSSVTTSRVEPIPAGTSIDIKAASTGAVNPLYQFWVDDGQGWKLIQDFSKTSSVTWKPDKEGTYTIWVGAKESNSTYSRDDFKQFSYTVNSGAQIDAVNFSKESPAKVGDSITVTAAASKSNNILYKFWIYDGLDWKVVQDYSEKNTYTWKPNHAGQHRVWAEVKDKYSTKEKDSYKEILYEVKNDVILSSATLSNTDEIFPGSSVEIKATSTGAINPLYQFWVDDGQGWKLIQDYSKNTSAMWKPNIAGKYTVWVGVKESNSTYSRDDFKQFSCNVTNFANIETVNFSKESPAAVGDEVKITVGASGSSNILYRFWIDDGTGWKVVQDYASNNTYVWKPDHAAHYDVWVDAKDKDSSREKDSYKEITYDVNKIGSPISGKVIVVDAGHNYGGDDGANATYNGVTYYERYLNMFMALKLRDELQKLGATVIFTREASDASTDDLTTSLKKRVDIANNAKADLFISLHHDKSSDTSTTGISVHYSTYKPGLDNSGVVEGEDPNGWYHGVDIDTTPCREAVMGRDLANKLAEGLSSSLGYNNLKAHDHNLYVTKNTNMPAVLIECGFMSNEAECKRSADSDQQTIKAQAIAKIVNEYFKLVK